MNRVAAIAFLALLALTVPPPAAGQFPAEFYSFEMSPLGPTTLPIVPGQSAAEFELEFIDASRDSTGPIVDNPAAPNAAVFPHTIFFDFEFGREDINGWSVRTPAVLNSLGGERYEVTFIVTAGLLIETGVMPISLIARTTQSGQTFEERVNVTVYSLGVQSFNAQPEDIGGEVKPGHVVDVRVRITNGALIPRGFDIEVTRNPCGMQVAASTNNLVGPKETKVYTISARAPEDKAWYISENCEIGFDVSPQDRSASPKSLTANVIVNGVYLDPQWVIWLVEILIVLLLIIFLLARRKERIEEEILGKPQKPWTIPVEAVYLKALKEKDERAWYVVRHHLMEEEYRSSLLWYKAYKKATKGSRKKETLVLRQEKAYKRWTKQWKREIAKPIKQADRFDAKLQAKLDRKARKLHRRQVRKVDKVVAKMQKAHANQVERALAKWEKESKRAAKKGQPLPKRPVVPEPDYPEEPTPTPIVLAEHKWAKRSARYRARMVRRQGDLEVKFEKADARRLRKLRRKVGRIARKLDDPQFIEEHPLLAGDKPAAAKPAKAS